MALANKTTTINDLCDDLLCQIFDRLSVKQVMAIQRVNKDFHRSAKTWFKSVDKFDVGDWKFILRKITGKPIESDDYIGCACRRRHGYCPNMLQHADKLLDTFTNIKNLNISSSITAAQVIHIIQRCSEIERIFLKLDSLALENDDDWNRLVQLIKPCEIRLSVSSSSPFNRHKPKIINQLRQLFTVAENVKTVYLNDFNVDLLTLMKTHLKQSATIGFYNAFFMEGYLTQIDDTNIGLVSDIIANRVVYLSTCASKLKKLPATQRFLKLVQLDLIAYSFNDTSNLRFDGYEFPRLKRLTISDFGHLIVDFYATVRPLNQLEQLCLVLGNYCLSDEHLVKMLEKTPNITKLKVEQKKTFTLATVGGFVKMFQLLWVNWTHLRIISVQFSVDDMRLTHFDRLCKGLGHFAYRRKEIKVIVDIKSDKDKKDVFKKRTSCRYLPRNVQVK